MRCGVAAISMCLTTAERVRRSTHRSRRQRGVVPRSPSGRMPSGCVVHGPSLIRRSPPCAAQTGISLPYARSQHLTSQRLSPGNHVPGLSRKHLISLRKPICALSTTSATSTIADVNVHICHVTHFILAVKCMLRGKSPQMHAVRGFLRTARFKPVIGNI